MKYFSLPVAIALLLLACTLAFGAPPHQERSDKFTPEPCSTFHLGDEFTCGYVSVPEYHAQPDGAQLKLGVAILPSASASPPRDAFMVAQGGPGGSTLDTFGSFFDPGHYPAARQIHSQRDIVLFDQRGTLYAEPSLRCPEELKYTFDTIEQDLDHQAELEGYEQAALACRARLEKEGVHLDAYNSFENALDVEDVRRALGYDKLDLYGVSYGTLLALQALRRTPETFRSVILDAVVPAQTNPNSEIAQSRQRAFEQLFSACAADARCNAAYPNLKQTFYETVDALNEHPARVPLNDKDAAKGAGEPDATPTKGTYNAVIDGDTFMDILFQFIYNSEILPVLPQMIADAHDGRFTLIEAIYPLLLFDRTFASGMYYSVMCAEDADFALDDLSVDGVDPHIADTQVRDTKAFLQLCNKWDVPQLGPAADEPVRANVPTMIFSGDFDPITPPENGRAAAETISPSYVYEFPAYGHGAMTSGNCPNQLIAAFVRNPQRAPDAQCIAADATEVPFVTQLDYMLSAGIGKLQLAILQGKIDQFVVPLILLVTVLSIWIVAPLAWLIRVIQKRPSEPQLLAKLTPWIGAGVAGIAFVFFAALLVLLIIAAVQNVATMGLAVGAPRGWLAIYLLPLAFTLGAIVFAAAMVLAWTRNNWDVLRRIYFSVVAGAALGLVAWFVANNLLFAFLA